MLQIDGEYKEATDLASSSMFQTKKDVKRLVGGGGIYNVIPRYSDDSSPFGLTPYLAGSVPCQG